MSEEQEWRRFHYTGNLEMSEEEKARGQCSHIMTPEENAALYDSLLPGIREVAWNLGYAVGTHGTWRTDMDLIAAPWIDTAAPAEVLAQAVADVVCGWFQSDVGNGSPKAHGRRVWTIHLWPEEDVCCHAYIDLSILPRITDLRGQK